MIGSVKNKIALMTGIPVENIIIENIGGWIKTVRNGAFLSPANFEFDMVAAKLFNPEFPSEPEGYWIEYRIARDDGRIGDSIRIDFRKEELIDESSEIKLSIMRSIRDRKLKEIDVFVNKVFWEEKNRRPVNQKTLDDWSKYRQDLLAVIDSLQDLDRLNVETYVWPVKPQEGFANATENSGRSV